MSPRVRKRGDTPSASRSSRNPRRQGAGAANSAPMRTASFWGDSSDLPLGVREVRITQDPSAVCRSLGQPPLPGRESISEYYLATVYGRAVTLAGALATAGGLISPETLQEERADQP